MQYLYARYGRNRAALIATAITYRLKSAIRDVGKALGFDVILLNTLAKSHKWWDVQPNHSTKIVQLMSIHQQVAKTSQQLRSIGVFVDEPDPGCFYWVIHESIEEATTWRDVSASEETFSTCLEAFESGNKALLKLVADKKTGPLSPSS